MWFLSGGDCIYTLMCFKDILLKASLAIRLSGPGVYISKHVFEKLVVYVFRPKGCFLLIIVYFDWVSGSY